MLSRVAAYLQLARVVDEGGLIGQMYPDRNGQLDVLFAGAEHPLDPLGGPVLARTRDVEQNLGVLGRVLHAHAAVTVGARVVREQVLVRRVVLID